MLSVCQALKYCCSPLLTGKVPLLLVIFALAMHSFSGLAAIGLLAGNLVDAGALAQWGYGQNGGYGQHGGCLAGEILSYPTTLSIAF